MKKNYLFTLAALLLGSTIANAHMSQGATAVIYNLLGTAVAEATEMTTNLENLPAGIYLAKVSMGENTTIIRFKK